MRRPVAVRVVGPMQWIVYPALITVAAVIVLQTPVELFGLHLPEPVIPMVLAFAWPLIRPSVLAPVVLVGLGLFLDIVTYGPLGLWGLALLAIYSVVLASRSFLAGQDTAVLFVWYAACCALAFLLAYVVMVFITRTPASLIAVFLQILPTLLLFPFAHRLIERFEDGDVRFR
jgi:rod shape-determining protein MreD